MQGRRLVYLARKRNEMGKALRIYSGPVADWVKDDAGKPVKDERGAIVPLSDGREPIFEAWSMRYTENRLIATAETVTNQPVSPSPSPPVAPSPHHLVSFTAEEISDIALMLSVLSSPEDFEKAFRAGEQYLFPKEAFRAAISLLDSEEATRVREWFDGFD
ncbi:MAG: hypothetical protein SVX43_08475, partial [Cyanobacteriota bacterium]|nr:hypothetical protein [Cyanobacteriota bacterium]